MFSRQMLSLIVWMGVMNYSTRTMKSVLMKVSTRNTMIAFVRKMNGQLVIDNVSVGTVGIHILCVKITQRNYRGR